MAVSNETLKTSLAAGEDLTNFQYHVIEVDGTLALDVNTSAGVLCNKPDTGQGCELDVLGTMKGKAGAAVSASAPLTVASGGWLITATSGTGIIGKNKEAAVSSGETFSFIGNFANGLLIA